MADLAGTVDSADTAEDTTDLTTDLTTAEDTAEDLAEGSVDTAAAGKRLPLNPSTDTRSGISTLATIYSIRLSIPTLIYSASPETLFHLLPKCAANTLAFRNQFIFVHLQNGETYVPK